MVADNLSKLVRHRVRSAAHALGAADPLPVVGGLIDRSFALPAGDEKYAVNTLAPGMAPFEPSFSEREPNALRFTLQPLGPESSPVSRRDEATREMRRLVGPRFGGDALRWFDERSEEWRGLASMSRLDYGAWFGSAFDRDGLQAAKVYYELHGGSADGLTPKLAHLVREAVQAMPTLVPVFTSISCRRERGAQRVTFVHRGRLQLTSLEPLMRRLGLAHRLPGLMQVVGLALGGRFELPQQSVLIGLSHDERGPELKLEIMLGRVPDVPASFLDLLAMGLAERPRELRALVRWLDAFTPDDADAPGNFSVLSVRVTRDSAARVSLYLRPIEFEIPIPLSDSDADADVASVGAYSYAS